MKLMCCDSKQSTASETHVMSEEERIFLWIFRDIKHNFRVGVLILQPSSAS